MRFKNPKQHSIDFVFPLSVLFVFAVSALLVLLLCANIYARQTSAAEDNYEQYTPLAYISEKLRQNDSSGGFSVTRIDGTACISIDSSSSGMDYITYLYVMDGWLKELYVRDGASVPLSAGQNIIEAKSLSVTELKDHLYKISVTDTSGHENSCILTERSRS